MCEQHGVELAPPAGWGEREQLAQAADWLDQRGLELRLYRPTGQMTFACTGPRGSLTEPHLVGVGEAPVAAVADAIARVRRGETAEAPAIDVAPLRPLGATVQWGIMEHGDEVLMMVFCDGDLVGTSVGEPTQLVAQAIADTRAYLAGHPRRE